LKKVLYISFLFTFLLLSSAFVSYAKEFETEYENTNQSKVDRYIKYVYQKIKFNKGNKLSFEAFKYGYYGYLNMVEAGRISPSSLLTICDYTLSSNLKRMWVIDISKKKVLFNTLVAHGMGTGEEYATTFSNIQDSHQSSLGFFTTGETYEGNNGYSLKLHGVDGSFNNNAFDRAVVIHGAEYVCDEYARCNKRIGRSHGCPALPVDLAPKIIDKIKNGSCLFLYHSSKNYLSSSYWLRNKIKHLPQEADKFEFTSIVNNNSHYKEAQGNDISCESVCDAENHANLKSQELKKDQENVKPKERVISSIILINENRNGISDTTVVK
jgi:hypothetical protein